MGVWRRMVVADISHLLAVGRNAVAIDDSEVKEFLLSRKDDLGAVFEDGLGSEFPSTYRQWILKSRLNQFKGLSETDFPFARYVHGTSQAFDHFFRRHAKRRVRFFKGEFAYHKIYCRDVIPWAFIEDAPISAGDAVIISLPFSDTGGVPKELNETLDKCHSLGVPVLIDAAYIGICRDINFDFSHPAIETVTSSLSKAFTGAAGLRIGIRFERVLRDDPVDFFNGVGMFSRIGAKLGTRLMNRFSCDFISEKYFEKQQEICKQLGVTTSACVIFANGDDRFQSFNRGGAFNRICLSRLFV